MRTGTQRHSKSVLIVGGGASGLIAAINGMKAEEAAERVVDMFTKTRNNQEFVNMVKKMKFI